MELDKGELGKPKTKKRETLRERRNHPRIKVSLTALYDSEIWSSSRVVTGADLSLTGIRIRTSPYRLFSDEDLEISFILCGRVIRCTGKVIHVQESEDGKQEAGIRFGDLSDQDRLYLKKYLSDRESSANWDTSATY